MSSEPMKVRIGYGLGTRTRLHDESYGVVVDALESLEFDSLWLSEKISGEAPDPLVAMAYGAGRTTKLKFGMSVMVLPGRNPVVLAKELATLGTMSGGRLLPAFGLGAVDPVEQQAFGVERSERAALFDETLEVMRKCWTGEPFSHDGPRFHYDGVVVQPAPKRMDVWLGGNAPSELRRVGPARRRLAAVVRVARRRRDRTRRDRARLCRTRAFDRRRPLRRPHPVLVRTGARRAAAAPGQAATRPRRRHRPRPRLVGRPCRT